jgi:cytochrome c-type biogenesis protein CcmI
MNEQLVLIVLGVVAAAFVLWPLIRGRGPGAPPPGPAAQAPVHPTAPDELAELELDRAMGRVSEADYERWRGELEADITAVEPAPPSAAKGTRDATGRAEDLVRQWREAPRPSCPTCGVRPQPEARFCSNCGAPLS